MALKALFPIRFGYIRKKGAEPILAQDVKGCVIGVECEEGLLSVKISDGLGGSYTKKYKIL